MKRIISMLLFLTVLASLSFSSCNIAEPIDLYKEVESPSESSTASPSIYDKETEAMPEASDKLSDESEAMPEASDKLSDKPEAMPEAFDKLPDESEAMPETLENTEANESAGSPSGGYVPADFWANDYEAYTSYINEKRNKKELPEDFISYDAIKEIGAFVSFSISDRYTNYFYNVIDENGELITIHIKPLSSFINTGRVIFSNDKYDENNLRKVSQFFNDDTWQFINFENINYRYYSNGGLNTINWVVNGKLFTVTMMSNYRRLSDYPLDGEETFVSRLLSKYTAIASVQSLNQKIKAYTAKNIADSKAQ